MDAPQAGSTSSRWRGAAPKKSAGHVYVRREDGIAENFHVEQNRELLQKLSAETGGQYYKPSDAQKLGKDINYSQAGIPVRETRDLWDMPVIFLLFLGIRAAEWLLRRRWGVI
jgi:hypothetical protein